MLENIQDISKIDKSGMIDTIEKFPEHIQETIEIMNTTDLPSLYKIDDIIISGMGASAISGDIIQMLFLDKFDIPIYVNRAYELPKWANKNTLVISQSYSGNTEETLSTFKHAYQKHCKILGISSGGKLEEYCKNRQLPHVKIPSGLQPRAATAYVLFSSLLSFKKVGLLQSEIESEIQETITVTKELRDKIKKTVPENQNPAKQLAKQIHNTTPQIYGWGVYTPIAKRWIQQFNENSKKIARYDEVPECNHNDIIGWSMDSDVSKKFTTILFRDSELETVYLSTRLRFMKKLFDDVASNSIEIHPIGKKRLAKMMYMMYLGDYTSCYLAILRNIDPTPVIAITELKNELSKI